MNSCAQPSKIFFRPAQYTGKERDSESGLDYFGARYYGSALGRFTSPDEFKGGFDDLDGKPAFAAGPLPYANLSDPQTLNKYVYTRNNPLRYIDPDGHDPEEAAEADSIVDVAIQDVDKVVKPLVDSVGAGGNAALEIVGRTAGGVGLFLTAGAMNNNASAEVEGLKNRDDYNKQHPQQQKPNQPGNPAPQDAQSSSEHTKGARPSTTEDHEAGQTRKKRDAGGEKGDDARKKKGMWPRRPPGGKQPKGGWPPKDRDQE